MSAACDTEDRWTDDSEQIDNTKNIDSKNTSLNNNLEN